MPERLLSRTPIRISSSLLARQATELLQLRNRHVVRKSMTDEMRGTDSLRCGLVGGRTRNATGAQKTRLGRRTLQEEGKNKSGRSKVRPLHKLGGTQENRLKPIGGGSIRPRRETLGPGGEGLTPRRGELQVGKAGKIVACAAEPLHTASCGLNSGWPVGGVDAIKEAVTPAARCAESVALQQRRKNFRTGVLHKGPVVPTRTYLRA